MKRFGILLLTAAVLLLMAACASGESANVYTVTEGDTEFTVDLENGTISDGINTYVFTASTNKITITYLDGATYVWNADGVGGAGGWSEDYDPNRYVDGLTLINALSRPRETQMTVSHPFLSIVLAIVGLWHLIWPRSVWYVKGGWRYKDAKPSEAALTAGRIGGGLALVLAVILLFV